MNVNKWWKHDDAADLNLSLHMLFLNAREGHMLAARVEAYTIERITGVSGFQAVQMANEVVMIQNGVVPT